MGHLAEKFQGIQSLKCLVLGDVMVDAYIWGKVDRISPEAPVPVFSVDKRENRLGGAANVALNVKSLGAEPILCGVVGNDAKGEIFLELMEEQNLSTEGIVKVGNRPTTSKTRIISANQHLMRIDEEESFFVENSEENQLYTVVKQVIERGIDVIVLEDYNKGVLSTSLIEKVIAIASEKEIPVCVDPKKENFNSYQSATLFKPNFKELVEGLKVDVETGAISEIADLGRRYCKDHKIKNLMVTLSEHGVMMIDEEDFVHHKAHKRKIIDVSGAGDTVISVAALSLAAGFTPNEVALVSNLAGGMVCEEVGVVPIEFDNLLTELKKIIVK